MAYKPVGADENGRFPTRVWNALKALIATEAADAASATRTALGLIFLKKTDAGAPTLFADELNAYAHVWKTPGVAGKLIAGIKKAGGWFYFPKGFDYADRRVRVVSTDQYLSASVDRNGRVMEDALDTQGNVPLNTIGRWGARLTTSPIVLALWPFMIRAKVTTKTIKKDGTGDFSTITAAIASITDSSLANKYELLIHPGVYSEVSIKPPVGVELRGTHKDRCIIKGELPASASDATVVATSTIDLYDPSALRNLTITGRNVRYPVHYEGAGLNKDSSLVVDNCHIEHFGNQDIIDYRVANSLPAGTPWTSWIAWGEGAGSGIEVDITRTTMKGRSAFYLHGSSDHDKPTNHRITNCRILASGGGVTINPIGSGTDDALEFTDTIFDAVNFTYMDSPWQTVKPESQVADHYEIRMTMAGCTPMGWVTTNRGKALRITSAATTAPSSVRVSGTAATVLFGEDGMWRYRDGGGGLAAYAYGYLDISGILVGGAGTTAVNNTLGKRLGDCSVTPKTLTVTLNGGAPVNVVFNTNLTAATNATILATINAALGAAGTASEYLVTQGERYPWVQDKELFLTNTGATGIPRWGAVRYGTDKRSAQIVDTADAASTFIGVALEPIAPGASGRVLVEGRLRYDQLFGFAPTTIATNATISLSTVTPGAFVSGSAKQVASAAALDWAYFKGNR